MDKEVTTPETFTVEEAFKRFFKPEPMTFEEYWKVTYSPHGWVIDLDRAS